LYQNDFVKGYCYWTSYGEIEPIDYGNVGNINSQNLYEHMISSPMHFDNTEPFVDHVGAIVNSVVITNDVIVSE